MLLLAFVILLLCFADENFFYPHKGGAKKFCLLSNTQSTRGSEKVLSAQKYTIYKGGAKKFCLLTYKVYSNKERAWRHMRELW